MSAAKRTGTLAVFYNGECPVCRPGIDHCRALSEAEGQRHRWIDIAADPAAATLVAAPLETIRRRLHVIDRDGRTRSGIDAFIALWRELPRYRWLAALGDRPAAHVVGAWLYDRVLEPAVAALNRRRARHAARPSVYERALGERFRELPGALQTLHGVRSERTMLGRAFVERGAHPLACATAALLRLPPSRPEQDLVLRVSAMWRGESWDRLFADAPLHSTMRPGRGKRLGLVVERLGPLAFSLRPTLSGATLRLDQVECRAFGLRLPDWACGRIAATETVEGGRIRFEVVADLPLVGRVIRYGGRIELEAERTT